LKRKADKVRQVLCFVTDEEVACALKKLDNDEVMIYNLFIDDE
jgi:hypothetical protein